MRGQLDARAKRAALSELKQAQRQVQMLIAELDAGGGGTAVIRRGVAAERALWRCKRQLAIACLRQMLAQPRLVTRARTRARLVWFFDALAGSTRMPDRRTSKPQEKE